MASIEQAIIWIHGDCLNLQQKALQDNPGSPAILVWDDDLLRRRQLSLKRITFIYERLLELPVVIRRGHVVGEIVKFAQTYQANTVITMYSVSPGFEKICLTLRENDLQLMILHAEAFVKLPSEPDLGRFSRYWRQAQKQLFRKQK